MVEQGGIGIYLPTYFSLIFTSWEWSQEPCEWVDHDFGIIKLNYASLSCIHFVNNGVICGGDSKNSIDIWCNQL